MIERVVWKALNHKLKDPDYGLKLREGIIDRLKIDATLPEDEFILAKEVATNFGLEW